MQTTEHAKRQDTMQLGPHRVARGALDDAAELFAAVFRDAPDGLIVVDAHSGAILETNRAVRHYLGYEPQHLVGRPFAALHAGSGGASVAERARQHGA
ncbi:MAG: PAS domain-containing protein, partial [Candidatus Binatia bacterium]